MCLAFASQSCKRANLSRSSVSVLPVHAPATACDGDLLRRQGYRGLYDTNDFRDASTVASEPSHFHSGTMP